MNTLSNTPLSLSLDSLNLLAINGYTSKFDERLVQFKRKYDFIGAFIVFFLFSIISLPIFNYSYSLGAGLFIFLVLSVYFHHKLISKKSTIKVDADQKHIEVKNRFGTTWFGFEQVESVFVKSTFNGTFTSADKKTSDEYDIVIGITLKSGKNLNLFFYKSDYREPNAEIMEVHDSLKSLLTKVD